SSEQVIIWGRTLARILATLHDHGIIYRDLKSANIMVAPDGRLRLIDFDIVQEAGTGMALWGGGTRGYMSPQHKAGAPASVSDDVYSLGAVLYLAATGVEPASSPHPLTLLERPIIVLNPAIDHALAEVIASCLNHDPAHRYQNMAEADTALAAIHRPHATPAPDLGCESPVAGQDPATKDYFHGLARRLGDSLARAAQPVPDGTGMAWTSLHNLAQGVQARDLNFGGAGALLALAEAVSVFGDPRHLTIAAEGARWLRAAPSLGVQPLPGLYVGEAGIGAGLLRAGQALADEDVIAAALRKGRLVGSLPHRSPDYFNGTAGRLRFHLLLWDETGEQEQLSFAIGAGEQLLATVDRTPCEGRGAQWLIPEGYGDLSGQAQLGYAHGLAGIADSLLDLYETTGEPRWRECARQAAYTLERHAASRAFVSGAPCLDWPIRAGGPFFGPFWCHGAAGIGQFFLHAARLDILPGAMEIALGAARGVARGSRHAGPTQCHGLTGNIEFLLDVYQASGDRAYLSEAHSLATLLAAFASERDGQLLWPSESPMIFTPDYLVGYAGVLPCLLRLADPERRPRQLSRAGFRYAIGAR
ncbi:MAG TPA: lanthionine synthetase LanC family protein, partial [Chloroflexota bacterium]|nr:lanthionine synthetase LanC family protein [Chloroflexota bacterium]